MNLDDPDSLSNLWNQGESPAPFFLQPMVPGWVWEALATLTAVMVGVGAIGHLLAEYLYLLGVKKFILLDPKVYKKSSVQTQCQESEVGFFKAAVLAHRLRRLGARAIGFPYGIENLEPGWMDDKCFMIVSADRRSADLSAHRMALWHGLRFYKVNLEPALMTAGFRFYDYSRLPIEVCFQCGLSAGDYAGERSPQSCEEVMERSTGSPRPLSALTAGWAASCIVSTLTSAEAAARFNAREFLLSPLGPTLSESILPAQEGCLSPHQAAGNLVRLAAGPEEITFQALALQAGFSPDQQLQVSSSGHFVQRCRCTKCKKEVSGLWWARSIEHPIDWCSCGARVYPVPFHSSLVLPQRQLQAIWGAPLASIQLSRRASITLSSSRDSESTPAQSVTFLSGGNAPFGTG